MLDDSLLLPSFQEQAVIWGHAYEILVKRGVLGYLWDAKLLPNTPKINQELQPWHSMRLSKVYQYVIRELKLIDEREIELTRSALEHLAHCAYGAGYTLMREYLKSFKADFELNRVAITGLWCPLTLPSSNKTQVEAQRHRDLANFCCMFDVPNLLTTDLFYKGHSGNADFILLVSGREHHVLIHEYSYDMPSKLGNFRDSQAHLDQLMRHRRVVESRGVFANVSAEVTQESFQLSSDIQEHLLAFTGKNKPLYKLCQASAYGSHFADLWHNIQKTQQGGNPPPIHVRALAITPNGLESLLAKFCHEQRDPRIALMRQLGSAYRQAEKIQDGDDQALNLRIQRVFKSLRTKLPKSLNQSLTQLNTLPVVGQDYQFKFDEQIEPFTNPNDTFSLTEAHALIPSDPAVDEFYGGPAVDAISPLMQSKAENNQLTLRDIHASAVVAAIRRSKSSQINVIGLEGNPGIGKTTAIRQHLEQDGSGFLFLYVSPRVIINRDVIHSMAHTSAGKPSGILTLTTNAQLNRSAQRYYDEYLKGEDGPFKKVDGCVIADGVDALNTPQTGSLLVLSPSDEVKMDMHCTDAPYRRKTLSEQDDLVHDKPHYGVLKTLGTMAHKLLECNPALNQLVLAAALQGFRQRNEHTTTIDGLSLLFKNKAHTRQGTLERANFAKRISHIVVMVDELTGDGAGAPFVHGIARWLSQEFLSQFDKDKSPFTITLILSDASLANEVVMTKYLEGGNSSPDKVLISKTTSQRCFDLAVNKIKIDGRLLQTLHVMTNSYPASELHVHYQIKLNAISAQMNSGGQLESTRESINRVKYETLISNACGHVHHALSQGAQQVIYFAQDKNQLRDLKQALIHNQDADESSTPSVNPNRLLNIDSVQVLDSSVPGHERKALIEPALQKMIKVYLMTSSGARGISFPRCDWIIADIPRFNIEASLMEVAQLIYRGRGKYEDESGKLVSGDILKRHLVMLIEDFVVHDPNDLLQTVQIPAGDQQRQWLRQSIDLMTLLVMIRATIWTRITGDAGLKQPMALVPVGGVGIESLVSDMSDHVSKFVREVDVYLRNDKTQAHTGLLKEAKAGVEELFSRIKVTVTAKNKLLHADSRTLLKSLCMDELIQHIANPVVALLPKQPNEQCMISDHTYFAGNLVFEDMANFFKEETFQFEGASDSRTKSREALRNQLYRIDKQACFSSTLRIPARALFQLLNRENDDDHLALNVIKALNSSKTWVVFPAGYRQFLNKKSDDHRVIMNDPDFWRDGLVREARCMTAIPALARYDSYPWVVAVGASHPLRLDQVFDDRYFMASSSFNLLNTLLLNEPSQSS